MTTVSAAYLADTNLLVYAYDPSDAAKRRRAILVLRRLIPFSRDYGILGVATIRRWGDAGEAVRDGVDGWEVEAVADAVGAGRRTVERWIDWYRHEGAVAGVLAHRQGGHGQVPRLPVAQQEQVGAEVATGRFRTAAEIGAWIAQTYGVTYRPGGVTSLLARLRCHPKVPRPLHEKADPDAQEAWKRGAWRTRSRPSASPSGK
jgi:transposase